MITVIYPPRKILNLPVDPAEIERIRGVREHAALEERIMAEETARIAAVEEPPEVDPWGGEIELLIPWPSEVSEAERRRLLEALRLEALAAREEMAEQLRIAEAEGRAVADLREEIAIVDRLLAGAGESAGG